MYHTSWKKISLLEAKEVIEDKLLEEVAKELKVLVEAIRNFDEEAAIICFNTFNDNSFSNSQETFSANSCTFNPLDKIVELYESLLKSEREKIELIKDIRKSNQQ